jgi:hypothetical protein
MEDCQSARDATNLFMHSYDQPGKQTQISLMTLTRQRPLHELICTAPPYYALQDLETTGGTHMQCRIQFENRYYADASPFDPAEVGRHLAILGSCVVAQHNPVLTKHYYLAFDALLERVTENDSLLFSIPTDTLCIGQGELELFGPKSSRVRAQLATPPGKLLYTLTVSYKVMRADLFEKIFRNQYQETSPISLVNPYAQPLALQHYQMTPDGATARMGPVRPEQCVGHFYQYPALPVAMLSGALVDLAGFHLRHLCGNRDIRYANRSTNVKASRLAFAGETVFLSPVLLRHTDQTYTFRLSAVNGDGLPIGYLESSFDLLN